MLRKLLWATTLCLFLSTGSDASAATYYVSPGGNDSSDGQSQATAWKSCEKVDRTSFTAGDIVLFQRGGEWHERLQGSADGAEGSPITYDAYGTGAKPKFWGSDILDNSKFTPAGEGQYAYPMATQADTALQDHVFIPASYTAGTLTITTPTDPRSDGKVYTACIRGNVILSNRKNHLVFRNLIVDETAGQLSDGGTQGYGIRIEGSTDVLLESCEAYRCGRHNIAAINTTGFVGRHLITGYVQPKTPGDNTAYVSYADSGAPVAKCTSEWDDISAVHLEDGKGGQYLTFVSHGDNQGSITIENSTATTKMSFMTAPVIVKHTILRENASIETFGTGALIDGVTLLDSAAIDQWGSGGTIQNCVAHLAPTGGGPTGYGTAIVCRDKAHDNVIRFNTLVTGKFSCLQLAGANSATKWFGNIFIADGNTIAKASGSLDNTDAAFADYNFYAPTASFAGKSFDDWKAQNFDTHSLVGDPMLSNVETADMSLKPGSPCLHAAKVDASDIPATDFAGKPRSQNTPSIGACE